MGELEVLTRAHQLFADLSRPAAVGVSGDHLDDALRRASQMDTGGGQQRYRAAVDTSREVLRATAATDSALASVIERAQSDHTVARELTRAVLEAARADTPIAADSNIERSVCQQLLANV